VVIQLPYGRAPYRLDLGDRPVRVLDLPRPDVPAVPVAFLLDEALARRPLPAAHRVTLIVSDPTRAEPRAAFIEAVRERLPRCELTIAVATGTHGPCKLDDLGIPPNLLAGARIVNHDGCSDLVELGMTSRGTPVRVHRCVVESDLVIATGCIRPHYFAGFGAGTKAIFPGLGCAVAVRINHRLKTEPGARAGIVDGNPCRADLEEAVARIPIAPFLLDGVVDADDRVMHVVAGDLDAAFREGVELARRWFTVRAAPSACVVASDALPVSASLYQAAKIAAAAAPLVAAHGMLVIVAECADGIGPLDVVNEAIFRIGVLPRLAPGVQLRLVSSLPPEDVARTLIAPAVSVEAALPAGEVLVLPRASHVIAEAA
jgi:nickel-dependent lactate racemase